MHSQQEDHLLAKPTVWLLFAFLLSLKCFLIGSYRSTDFEVHRNWMAITHNFPLEQWYQSNISQWTLDYPPFFAYFEWLLAKMADLFEPAILTLQSEPFISIETILFQRLSVIAVDLIYFISCACISSSHVDRTSAKGYAFRQRMSLGLCTFLVCNPALIMLDNIHFQYNGFLYAIFLLSLNAIINGKLLRGALLFAILLNFKHLYLYYAPAFIGFFFCSYLMPFNRTFFIRTLQLGLVLTAIFCLSFGPFLLKGGIDSFYQILGRLFPFKRGLTHANWAPNFWALYNFMDFILAKIFGKVCHYTKYSSLLPLKKCPPTAPEYIRGLAKEYGHSVLPDITPPITLALILVSLTPCFTLFARTKKQATSAGALLPCLTLSAFSFFLFGWHVHEKAILMVFFPFALLSVKDPRFLEPFCLLCIASTFAQFPLLFTPIEILVKWALVLAFLCLSVFLANHIWAIHPAELVRCPVAKLLARGMFLAEFYTLFHPVFFGSTQFSFMPILISSVACALAVFYSYLSLLITLFGQQMGLLIQNRKLLKKEKDAEKEVPLLDMETVKHIAGIDLSQSVSQPSMAVVTLTVLAYPSMEVVYTANEVVMLSSLGGVMPYVPEFLAIREAKPLRRVLSRHLPQCPKIDLLFVDSNGKWHSRGCGLACHVGFDIGVPTIGLAKNFNGFPLFALGLCEREQLQEIEQQIGRKCKESTEEAAIFEFLLNSSNVNSSSRCPGLAILRTKTSNSPFFVSPGFGISFESAMAMAFECIGKQSASVNPVRLSDLRSRRRVQEIFEE